MALLVSTKYKIYALFDCAVRIHLVRGYKKQLKKTKKAPWTFFMFKLHFLRMTEINLLPRDKFYNIVMRSYELRFWWKLKRDILVGKNRWKFHHPLKVKSTVSVVKWVSRIFLYLFIAHRFISTSKFFIAVSFYRLSEAIRLSK